MFLDETGAWSGEYFDSKKFNCHRRQIFFAVPQSSWADKAPSDANPFANKKGSSARKAGTKKSTKKTKPTQKKTKKRKKAGKRKPK